MGVAPAHIGNGPDFFRGMLVRVVVWPPGTVTQGFNGAVITAFPAVGNDEFVFVSPNPEEFSHLFNSY